MFMNSCLSCRVLAGKIEAPGGVIYEDTHWMVTHRLPPILVRGYLIILLKRHCEHLAELTPEEAAAFGPLMQNVCLALTRVLKPAKVHVASWGEEVRHIHFHVLPRAADMPVGNRRLCLWLGTRAILHQMGLKRWAHSQADAADVADRVRQELRIQPSRSRPLALKVDSVQLYVPDLEAGLAFYRDRLGHEVIWRTARAAGLRLPETDAEIVLQIERQEQEVDLLVESADAAATRFEASGGKIEVPPFDIQIGRCVVVRDPWGNQLVLLDASTGLLIVDQKRKVIGSTGQ